MKKMYFAVLSALCLSSAPLLADPAITDPNGNPVKIAILNPKTCYDESKLGKQEQANLEALKKQMEVILEEREKTLNDMATKLNDNDYLDSLSPEAETELKRKFRALGQELGQLQQQYMQALQQANYQVLSVFNQAMADASKRVAQEQKIDIVLSEETSFFYSKALDISKPIVVVMDEVYDKEQQAQKDEATKPVK